MPPSRSWFPDCGRGSQWRPRALDCDGRRERSVRVGRSGAAGAPSGDVHSVGARRCLGPTSNRNARFSALFFEKLDFKICFAPSRRDSTSHDSGNVERAPRWQTVWRDRWRTNFKSWASTPEIQTVESERLFLAPCWDEAEKIGPRKTPASAVNSRESLARVVVSDGAGSRALGSVGSRGATPHAAFLDAAEEKESGEEGGPRARVGRGRPRRRCQGHGRQRHAVHRHGRVRFVASVPSPVSASHVTRPSSPTVPVPLSVRSQEPAKKAIAHPNQDEARGTVRAAPGVPPSSSPSRDIPPAPVVLECRFRRAVFAAVGATPTRPLNPTPPILNPGYEIRSCSWRSARGARRRTTVRPSTFARSSR